MRFDLSSNIKHIFVLGAGSSVPYGLPTWKGLGSLIREKLNKDKENIYTYKSEMLDWVDKVGEGKQYETLDKCIEMESVSAKYHLNGHDIENQIFLTIKEIFSEVDKESSDGWIKLLNESIRLNQNKNLEKQIAFINYNYDDVLEKKLLNFSYLPTKKQIFNSRVRLSELSNIFIPTLYPHGSFYSRNPSEYVSHLDKQLNTMKSAVEEYLDVVSCYESEPHSVINYGSSPIKLYILGLGGGLQINLNNIEFRNSVSEVHVTINDMNIKDGVISFLSDKYKIPKTEIKIYTTCDELIARCFAD